MIRTEDVEARAFIGMLLSRYVDNMPTHTRNHNIDLFDRCRTTILTQCKEKLNAKSSIFINLKK